MGVFVIAGVFPHLGDTRLKGVLVIARFGGGYGDSDMYGGIPTYERIPALRVYYKTSPFRRLSGIPHIYFGIHHIYIWEYPHIRGDSYIHVGFPHI